MPVFVFDTDAGKSGPQRASISLGSIREAKIEAVRYLGELLAQDGAEFWEQEEVSLTVCDSTGLVLFRLCLFGTTAAAAGGR